MIRSLHQVLGMMADRLNLASSMTVAHTLSAISYHIVANPVILAKLQAELVEVQPKSKPPPKWAQLEQLPYLVRIPRCLSSPTQSRLLADSIQSAIIQEGLRSVSFQQPFRPFPPQTRPRDSHFSGGATASRTGFSGYHQTLICNTESGRSLEA